MDDGPVQEKTITKNIGVVSKNLMRMTDLTNKLADIISRIERPEPKEEEGKKGEAIKPDTLTDRTQLIADVSESCASRLEDQVLCLDRLV